MAEFNVLDLISDKLVIEKYMQEVLEETPYHSIDYLRAEKSAEEGTTKVFVYEDNGEYALIPMVVKTVSRSCYPSENESFIYDMITPHEYGGVLSNTNNTDIKKKLLERVLFYCLSKNIIFQFIRINPYLLGLSDLFKECGYQVIHSCDQVYVDLKQTEEEIMGDYKANVRRNIRRAKKEGLTFEIEDSTRENIEIFSTMYRKSMELLQAKKFLYFNMEYFRRLVSCECSKLCFVKDQNGDVAAASILLLGKNIIYYHLGCFDRNYALKRPMNYLIHSMILWGKREGYQIFHLGGGSQSLFQFKGGYSSSRIEYYIANIICDTNKYQKICEKWRTQFPQYADKEFYPLYRYAEL